METDKGYPRLFSGTLTRDDSRSCRRLKFFVPPGAREVMVKLSYNPRHEEEGKPLGVQEFRERWDREIARYREKAERAGDPALLAYYERFVDEAIARIQPLSNLLNLAVFDSAGAFRGRWDSPQHFAEWVSIGEVEATRGFVAGAIRPGEWTVILECHAVVTDACTYELEVQCVVSGGSWYRGELHAHTNHSDGTLSPDELVAVAAEAGLDFIAVTDHNTVSALSMLDALGRTCGTTPQASNGRPLVIPGMELTTFYGHAVAIGVSGFVPWHDASKDGGLSWQAAEVHRQGGILSIAHPFSIGYPVCAGCEWEYENTDLSVVDLMEVWSGPWSSRIIWNVLALRWWDEMLCRGHRVTGVAARDVHKREELFRRETADTYVWARSLSQAGIMEGLKAGRVFMSSGPVLDFSLRTGGCETRYLPGDHVQARRGDSLVFAVKLHPEGKRGANGLSIRDLSVRIVEGTRERGVRSLCTMPLDGGGYADFGDVVKGEAWYRCEVIGSSKCYLPGPNLVAVSNPIYIELTPSVPPCQS
ncbi:MAG: CehA/McbA family metallohydrolase [Bacillota bacterium]